jgi:hypothetical protein
MSAWDDVQTEDVKQIEATVFRQMEGRSNSDPCSPWADLALALCQRIAAAEQREKDWRDFTLRHPELPPPAVAAEIGNLRSALSASEARAKEAEDRASKAAAALEGEMGMRDFENCCCASDAPPHDKCCNDDDTRECRRCLSKRADASEARAHAAEEHSRGLASALQVMGEENAKIERERDEARRALRECAEVLETHGLENSEAYQLARALARLRRASHPGEER